MHTTEQPTGRATAGAAPAIALALVAVAAFALALAAVAGLVGQDRTVHYGSYLIGFGALLPAAAVLAFHPGIHRASAEAMRDRGVALWIGLIVALCAVRLLAAVDAPSKAGDLVSLAAGAGLGVAAFAAAWCPEGGDIPRWRRRAHRLTPPERIPLLALAGFTVVVLVFAPEEIGPKKLALAAVLAAAAYALANRLRAPGERSRWWILADVAVLALVASLTIDVSGYWGEDVRVPGFGGLYNPVSAAAQLHQHFFLGAVNDIQHGRTLLVDTNAVYGIGNTYLIALWFTIFPLGYGLFTLFGGVMAFVVLAIGWAIARAAGVGRLGAAIVIGLGLLLMVLAPPFPPSLYNNLGGIRFIPPYALVAVAMAVRSPTPTRSPWVVLTMGIFATWSFESITPCLTAFGALMAIEGARAATVREALAGALRSVGALLAGLVVVHVAFGVVTLLVSGSWPDWGMYIDLFRAWSKVISLTFGQAYLVEGWSRVWLIGFLYGGSIIGAAALVRSGDAEIPRRAPIALAGLSGGGVGFLTYFISHASDVYLLYIAMPALVVAAIWLTLASRLEPATGWRAATAAAGVLLAAVLATGAASRAEDRFSTTLMAHVIPGGASLGEDVGKMWDSPEINPYADDVVGLLDRYFPDDEALVLVEPDLAEEALLRSGRANLLPIAYLWQDEVDLDLSLPPVERRIDELEPGTYVLLQDPPGPDAAPVPSQVYGNVPADSYYGPLAQAAYDHLRERFRIERVAEGPWGVYVGRLEPREGTAP